MITVSINSRTEGISLSRNIDTNYIGVALKRVFIDSHISNKMIRGIRITESYRPKAYQTFDAKYDSDTRQLLYRRSGYNYPFSVE